MPPDPMTTPGRSASWSGLRPASYRSSRAARCAPARREPNLSWCQRRNPSSQRRYLIALKAISTRSSQAAALRRMMLARNRKFEDSPLEGDGFEISVPRYRRWSCGSPRYAIRVASEFAPLHRRRELDWDCRLTGFVLAFGRRHASCATQWDRRGRRGVAKFAWDSNFGSRVSATAFVAPGRSVAGEDRDARAGDTVQLEFFSFSCRASHSIEPGAGLGGAGCGLRGRAAAWAAWSHSRRNSMCRWNEDGRLNQSRNCAVESTWSSCLPLGKTVIS